MLECPECRGKLKRARDDRGGLQWMCDRGHGLAVTMPVLRRSVEAAALYGVWAHGSGPACGRRCPSCSRSMALADHGTESGGGEVDVCRTCHLLWFDSGELEQLPESTRKQPTTERAMDPRAEAAAQVMKARLALESLDDATSRSLPGRLPAALGLPVNLSTDWSPMRHLVAWGLAVALALVFLVARPSAGDAWIQLAFIPAEPFRLAGLTALTTFFVHANLWHLLGNAYVLIELGGDAEDELGRGRLLLLLAAGTLAGSLAHAALTADPTVPLVGASGGISALLAFYALRFPRRKVGLLIYTIWVQLPVGALFVLWLILQVLGLLGAEGAIAYGAHLGGAAVGLATWRIVRSRDEADRAEAVWRVLVDEPTSKMRSRESGRGRSQSSSGG